MSGVLTRRCALLLLLLFIKLDNDGAYSMEVQSAAEMGPDPEETPLDELQDILDELEMEESSLDLYYHQKKYKELDSQGQCTNKNTQCHAWSCRDECHKNPAYMRPKCTWSCGACGPLRSCVDKNKNCDAWMKRGECTKNPNYMLPNCCWSCMACPTGTCKDRHPHCAYWACIGECEKNPRYMLINCRGSCNVCRQNGNNNPVKAGENCPEPQAKVPKPTCHQKVDVMVLMDGSASVQRRNFPDVKNFVLTLAAGFDFGANGARVGVYQYAIGVQKEIGLNQFNNRQDLLDGIKGITFMEGMGTLTGAALTKIQQDFTTANGARPGVKKI
ncbi:putative tyrosinase-like protein tyr-3 [Branchiostoma floridae]|uniref:Tyrosinase-like protein tyr-3 n=1 Tax=Branchiostoma floridae TaxID=7739 RepID=A0A9J7MIY8_BRAFL|nr:putative tyrosinase-like protein tyr-3 [Branchiostoma floridae]